MGNFRKDNRSGGGRSGRSFGGGRDSGGRGFGGRDRERPDMHKAVCDECGQSCEVPFRPTGDKPIYCSDCFRNKGDGGFRDSNRGRRDRSSFGDRADRQMHSAVCASCGEKCEVPFRPSGDKPVYCDQCFDKNKGAGNALGGKGGVGDNQLRSQLDALNIKLDKILKILGGEQEAKKSIKKESKETNPLKAEKKAAEEAEAKEIATVIEEMKAMDVAKKDKSKKEKKPATKKKVVAKKKK